MAYKKYVEMIVKYLEDGTIMPLAIHWNEGELYEIDRVVDIRPCASLKAGGAGIRYTCMIQGRKKYIWLEENKWFVEAKGDKLNVG
ncbi:hypothetical protein [Caproiciproducens faecalis]|uniref:Uncharacterized protein n=1 Tax=Caproiciproducens faecalis TaxID=2820301 RepID=A0ABS7DPE5_9FIRM|nr:hypothetical protein [Caproiciproducens faecalis]